MTENDVNDNPMEKINEFIDYPSYINLLPQNKLLCQ